MANGHVAFYSETGDGENWGRRCRLSHESFEQAIPFPKPPRVCLEDAVEFWRQTCFCGIEKHLRLIFRIILYYSLVDNYNTFISLTVIIIIIIISIIIIIRIIINIVYRMIIIIYSQVARHQGLLHVYLPSLYFCLGKYINVKQKLDYQWSFGIICTNALRRPKTQFSVLRTEYRYYCTVVPY